MNKVILMGRPTKEVVVNGDGEKKVARYTLAVDNPFKRDDDAKADFISCVAFGKNADFAEKHVAKGVKIAVEGRIQTGSYTKDGKTIYTTDVVVERHEFCERKSDEVPFS